MIRRVLFAGLLLMSATCFAGVVDFTVTVDVSKEPAVCATGTSVDCLASTQLYYLNGTTRINVAQGVVPAGSTGTVAISIPGAVVKKYGKGVVFFAVMQGRDSTGATIESNPTGAAPVDLIPGKPQSVSAVVP